MFRLLQGDVGSGKTIVSLIAGFNSVNSGFQVAFMAPTEILAKQHYTLAQKIMPTNFKMNFISGKLTYQNKQKILTDLENHSIDIIFGTHAIFQKRVFFKK